MNKKALIFLLLLVCFLLVFMGCNQGSSGGPGGSAIKVTDFRGKTITLDAPAENIACMLDSGLTMLHMLGVNDEVIAVDKWTYDNPALPYSAKLDERLASKELPAVTGNIEKLISLKPDIVIIWAEHEDIEVLENNGIKVYGV
ncbi:MAG: hypothetical protein Q7I94_01290 [Candidatus Contubernalis sp.]|nr:hypothetical protein [Candidatus Contubernalis sp.]